MFTDCTDFEQRSFLLTACGRYYRRLNTLNFLLILFNVFFLTPEGSAQNPDIRCTHYNIDNGLINNNIEWIYRDSEGFVWFATATGLQQFDGYSFINYKYEPENPGSISYNFITAITEDVNGGLWIGTLGMGLNIFDKKKKIFNHIKNDNTRTDVLNSNFIPRRRKAIAFDPNGYIWVSTDMGLNRIHPDTYDCEHFHNDLAGDILYDDQLDVFWIASNRLTKFNPESGTEEHFHIDIKKYLDFTRIISVIIDRDGWIWLGTDAGLILFEKKTGKFKGFSEYLRNNSQAKQITYPWNITQVDALYEDPAGYIWIAIERKLFKLNKSNGEFTTYSHEPDDPQSLLDGRITGIYGGGKGILWICYESKGVSKLLTDLKEFQQYRHIFGVENSLSGNEIRSVFKDKFNNLWVGTFNDGLNQVLPDSKGTIIHYKHDLSNNRSINSNYVTAVYVDKNDRLWVGTFDGGFSYAENISAKKNLMFTRFQYDSKLEVQDFAEDPAGRIWVGSQNGFFIYQPDTKQLIHYGNLPGQLPEVQTMNIQSVIFEEPDVFWFATWNTGFCKLYIHSDKLLSQENRKDSLIIYNNIRDINGSLIDRGFTTIHKDRDNNIWLGSNVNGLIRMIEKDGIPEFIKYGKPEGAPDNSVYGIQSDKAGNIWFSTNHGLGKFHPETGQFQVYFNSDGLPSNSFFWGASFQSNDGEIFFGGANGLTAFYPERIHEESVEFPVYISKLILQNKEVKIGEQINGRVVLSKDIRYTESITLTHLDRAIAFEFTSLYMTNPEEVNFAYKLEGFDKDWIATSSEVRYTSYTNLPQGSYCFNVRASYGNQLWNESIASLHIKILPPWWKTIYAVFFYFVLLLFLLYFFRRIILMRTRLIHETRLEHMKREKEAELYDMKIRFFTDISHEFRTPLSLILAPLQSILPWAENNPKISRQVNLIRKNSDRLLRLIDQIMDLRKIDTNKMRLELRKADIVACIKELTDSFDDIAMQRSILLEFSSKLEIYETWFDENKLEKIIYNLLSNAFKYTPDKGRIVVNLSLKKNEIPLQIFNHEITDYLEIRIIDNGIGISPEQSKHIFERFYRAEKGLPLRTGGAGIGLALAKELVEMLQGKIKFESEINKGSSFIVLLPVGDHLWSEQQKTEIPADEKVLKNVIPGVVLTDDLEYIYKYSEKSTEIQQKSKKPVVLLVDDEADFRAFLREYLETNYRVYEAPNGIKGLKIAARIDPDIIISDVLMPGMDGIEMCQKLKSGIYTGHIPIILLSARSGAESRLKGLETGADIYIEKPFSPEILEKQISNILKTRKILRQKFSKELLIKPADITVTPLDAILLEKASAIVEKHMSDTGFGSDEFSREMGMSRSKLHRKLKALTSMPASEFIRTIRIKRAAQLIKSSQLSVSEISVLVGFSSHAYFTKCFKSIFGKAPTEYK